MAWFGADPGGKNSFGVARLNDDGSFVSGCVTGVDEAVEWIAERPKAIGIDCPMWWSSSGTGDRRVDQRLRKHYKISSGTIQTVNSLRGAAIIQGPMLVFRINEKYSAVPVTEAHPKALLKSKNLQDAPWDEVISTFSIEGDLPSSEHARDAILCAVAARDGFSGRWKNDLSVERNASELDPKAMWFGRVSYYWPEGIG